MRKAFLHRAFLASVVAMAMTVSAQAQPAAQIQPTPQSTEVNLIPFPQGPNPPSATAGGYVLSSNSPTASIVPNTAPNTGFSIMQVLYGSSFSQLSPAQTQTFLNTQGIQMMAAVRYAGAANTFGYYPNGSSSFSSILQVTSGQGFASAGALTVVAGTGATQLGPNSFLLTPGQSGSPFEFGLNGNISSNVLGPNNPDHLNHLAVFQIGGSSSNVYALAWEDGVNLGDHDYNDLVIQIQYVPEPSTMAIAGLGTIGFVAYGLRRRKAKRA